MSMIHSKNTFFDKNGLKLTIWITTNYLNPVIGYYSNAFNSIYYVPTVHTSGTLLGIKDIENDKIMFSLLK